MTPIEIIKGQMEAIEQGVKKAFSEPADNKYEHLSPEDDAFVQRDEESTKQ